MQGRTPYISSRLIFEAMMFPFLIYQYIFSNSLPGRKFKPSCFRVENYFEFKRSHVQNLIYFKHSTSWVNSWKSEVWISRYNIFDIRGPRYKRKKVFSGRSFFRKRDTDVTTTQGWDLQLNEVVAKKNWYSQTVLTIATPVVICVPPDPPISSLKLPSRSVMMEGHIDDIILLPGLMKFDSDGFSPK